MRIDEEISVELTSTGSPIRFQWRGIIYGVISAPEPWIARREWWRLAGRAPRGAGSRLLEVPMWRVDAVPLTDGVARLDGTFDLGHNPVTDSWQLCGATNDRLDQQLFA